LGNRLSKLAADPEALAKDPTKALQGEVGGVLGGNAPQPPAAGRAGTPTKR